MLNKIEAKKDSDDRDAIWVRLHKDSVFIEFIIDGEFESEDLELLEEIDALKDKIKKIL